MGITSLVIEKFVGLKSNTLEFYIENGALNPDIGFGSGTGSQHLFSTTNVMEAAIIHRMMSLSISKRLILAILKSINKSGKRPLLNPQSILKEDGTQFLMIFSGPNKKLTYNICTIQGHPSSSLEAFFIINLTVMAKKYINLEDKTNKAVLWDKILNR